MEAASSASIVPPALHLVLACNSWNKRQAMEIALSFSEDFKTNSDKIKINTDARSRKIEELIYFPFAEFQINGRADVIDGLNSDTVKLPVKLEIVLRLIQKK